MIRIEATHRLMASEDQSDGVPGNAWVVIGTAGRGRQTTWPKAAAPGVYKKTTAERILKEREDLAKKINSSIDWHIKPLEEALNHMAPGNPAYHAIERIQEHFEG